MAPAVRNEYGLLTSLCLKPREGLIEWTEGLEVVDMSSGVTTQ
jgi:hypothetical protein